MDTESDTPTQRLTPYELADRVRELERAIREARRCLQNDIVWQADEILLEALKP